MDLVCFSLARIFHYVTHEVMKAKVIFSKPHSSYQLPEPSSSLLTVFLLLRAVQSLTLQHPVGLISAALSDLVQCQTFLSPRYQHVPPSSPGL